MSEIEKMSDLENKTVSSSVNYFGEYIAIHFTDGDSALFGIDRGYGDDAPSMKITSERYLTINEKFELGFITHKEYESLREKEREVQIKQAIDRELKLLDELKIKYEGKT